MATTPLLSSPLVAFIRLSSPVLLEDFCEIRKSTRFLALFLGPPGTGASLLNQGRALGALLTDPLFCQESAYMAASPSALLAGISTYMEELTVLPPNSWDPSIRLEPPKTTQTLQSRMSNRVIVKERSRRMTMEVYEDEDEKAPLYDHQEEEEEDEALQFTGRLFGGLVKDIKRKLPWYASDFTDAIHVQTLASVLYIYLATVTKAITFGGFLGDITDGLQVHWCSLQL